MASIQEIYGRKGRVVTDMDAKDISKVEELSYDLRIRDVMTPDICTVQPEIPMKDLLEILRQHSISGAPVVFEGKLTGIVSLEDLIRSMVANDINAPVSKYMTTRVVTVNDFDFLVEALETFTKSRLGRLPVVDKDGSLVGMITKGDITRGFLIALQKDYHAEEVRRYRASHLFEDIVSDRTSLILRYNIKAHDFTNGGNASSKIKRALLRMGASPVIARRCGIAIYEAEMNLIIHTNNGGIIRVEIEPHQITMRATDDGPGIPNVQLAMQVGYSTASDQVRELGFGAGMGLNNIKRCVDKMTIESVVGKGTRLELRIALQPNESFREAIEEGEKFG